MRLSRRNKPKGREVLLKDATIDYSYGWSRVDDPNMSVGFSIDTQEAFWRVRLSIEEAKKLIESLSQSIDSAQRELLSSQTRKAREEIFGR